MALEQTIELSGEVKLMAQLDALIDSAARRVMKPAINKGLTPVNKDAKKRAKMLFKSTYISKMIGKKIYVSKKGKSRGAVIGMIFVRDTKKKNKRQIKVNGRMVDFSVAAMIQEFGRKDGSLQPHPFMRPAMIAKKAEALAIIKKEVPINLKKVIAKAKAKGKVIKK